MKFEQWYKNEIIDDLDPEVYSMLKAVWEAAYDQGYDEGWEDGSSIHSHNYDGRMIFQ